jgi:hypothetical protein
MGGLVFNFNAPIFLDFPARDGDIRAIKKVIILMRLSDA